MTSPGPKSPGPDAQPPEPVHGKESHSKMNGHPPPDEPALEPKPKSAEEPPTKKMPSEGETALSPKGDQPSEKPADKATDDQAAKATDKAADEQADNETEKPVDGSTEKPVDGSTEKTVEKPADKPAGEKDEKATDKAADEQADKATEKPVDGLTEKPSDEPADEQADKAKQADKAAEKPVDASTEKSADKPTVTPTGEESADKPTPDEKSTSIDDTATEAGVTETDKPKQETLQPETTFTPAAKDDDAKSSADQKEKSEPVEANEPGSTSPDAKESVSKSSEKPLEAAAEDDVSMIDCPPEVADHDSAAPVADEQTAAPTSSSGNNPEHDMVMTDMPCEEEAAQPPKPSVSHDAAPDAAKAPVDTEVDLGSAGLSQLAIESAGKESSRDPPPADDALMVDAPSAKIARERDEDHAEEPAPKRARTEPTEDEAMQKTPADAKGDAADETAAAPATVDAPILDELFPTRLIKWTDATVNASLITSFQRQEIRKHLTKLRKNKLGSPFKDSVEKLWPDLWNSYQLKIDRPMDLGQLERSLRVGRDDSGNAMQSFADFKKNLALIFENSLAYNGAAHHVTEASANVVRTVWEEAMRLPSEEPARPKPPPKTKPVRESRAAATSAAASAEAAAHHRPSAAPTTTTTAPAGGDATATKPAEAALPTPTTAPPAEAAPQPPTQASAVVGKWQPGGSGGGGHRRSLTAADIDRPKRKVRAPKPKDIDYSTKPSRKKMKPELQFCDEVLTELMHSRNHRQNSTKPSRKKMKPELQFCDEVLTELMHSRNHRQNSWFMEPVDAEGLNIPTYYATIKKPMDLGKVRRMLSGGEIANAKDFDKNVRLIFDNCYKFNGPPSEKHPVSALARELEELYTEQMDKKDEWLSKHAAKANAAAASASNASDDEDGDDDDDDDGGGGGADAVVDSVEVGELRAKLDEETRKLNELILGGNQSLIKIHKGIVDMVQDALMEAVQKAREAKAKRGKSKKSAKGGKVNKTPGGRKSGGGGGGGGGGGSSQAKKSGGSKKATKRNLTAAEMDQVANAINDLEHPHLQRAIDIIKKDTGQNENTDGELELDIEQLSNDAMLKLWDLCKKALPAFGKDSTVAPDESAEVNRGAGAKQAPKTAATKRKNKPMSAQEQDARIAQLKEVSKLYRPPGQEPAEVAKVTQAPTPMGDSSEDSDSEEE
ncbi:hypothetical protein L249_1221 [Ophiocordyceps polyrhachis-furcata BCC 54312]|uniref:Bromo domain-containing protein n=1 Tax=Ophiocordyceps polyrhachis-furcata BCC 54312 TaxID=1330021 RepID=A0A367LG48_9HYPO|nr:hypothetical protein L249_1221 [Ophiocordyceps polyrhachis-furcata BCC 54312]